MVLNNAFFITLCLDCPNGEVVLNYADEPQMYWNGKLLPICGNDFWDDNVGADLFCQKLGYESGTVSKKAGPSELTDDALHIGKCQVGDTDLTACTGGNNDYVVSQHKDCNTDDVFTITCNGASDKRRSCVGKTISIRM